VKAPKVIMLSLCEQDEKIVIFARCMEGRSLRNGSEEDDTSREDIDASPLVAHL